MKEMKNRYPKVIINTKRIAENVRMAVDKCAAVGIDIMGITKVSAGLTERTRHIFAAEYIR